MFQAIVQKAEGAVSSAVGAVVWRAAVAVPLVIAGGFGIAALTVKLSQAYGPALAYTIMADLFVAVAGITAAIMSRKEQIVDLRHHSLPFPAGSSVSASR